MTKIYVDLDGVLADFDTKYNETFGSATRHDKELWKNIKGVDKWFFNLPLMKDAIVLVEYLKAHPYGFMVLTATGHDYEDVSRQKIAWSKAHLRLSRDRIITVPNGVSKSLYAESKYDILIDDTQKVIDAWRAYGGTGILHTSAEDTIKQLKEFT